MFIVLTFCLSFPLGLWAYGFADDLLERCVIAVLFMMMPALAAFVVRYYREQKDFSDVGWEIGRLKWYAAIFGICVAARLASAGLDIRFGAATLKETLTGAEKLVMALSVFDLVPAFGEEFGWRGYLLPRLLQRYPGKHGKAVCLVGIVWGIWHWPNLLGPLLRRGVDNGFGSEEFRSFLAIALAGCAAAVAACVVLSAIFGALWLSCRSILLLSFLHACYIGPRDILSILLVNSSWIRDVVGMACIVAAFAIALRILRRSAKRAGSVESSTPTCPPQRDRDTALAMEARTSLVVESEPSSKPR